MLVHFDRRDDLEESASNPTTVAAEAHRLYESDAFREDVVEALGPVFRRHLDCEAVDAEAEVVLREWFTKEGMGGLFQIRNQTVSNCEAELDEGDVIYMTSARDPDRVIPHVVRVAEPNETGVRTWHVDPDDGEIRGSGLSAGFVKFVDRFEVDRSERGRDPYLVAWEFSEGGAE